MNAKNNPSVVFKPWIGKNYNNGGQPRILVLGESHYFDEDFEDDESGDEIQKTESNFTTHVINNYIRYLNGELKFEGWMRTFTRFTNIFAGKAIASEELIDFWNSICFYNYVQYPITKSRTSPTKEQFEKSECAFFEVLNLLKPQLIIVWGDRLWENMSPNGEDGEAILDGGNGKLFYYRVDDIRIPAIGIYHPASSALIYKHHKYIKEAIRLADN